MMQPTCAMSAGSTGIAGMTSPCHKLRNLHHVATCEAFGPADVAASLSDSYNSNHASRSPSVIVLPAAVPRVRGLTAGKGRLPPGVDGAAAGHAAGRGVAGDCANAGVAGAHAAAAAGALDHANVAGAKVEGAHAEEDDDARKLTNAAADEDEGVHARGGDDGNLEIRTC